MTDKKQTTIRLTDTDSERIEHLKKVHGIGTTSGLIRMVIGREFRYVEHCYKVGDNGEVVQVRSIGIIEKPIACAGDVIEYGLEFI